MTRSNRTRTARRVGGTSRAGAAPRTGASIADGTSAPRTSAARAALLAVLVGMALFALVLGGCGKGAATQSTSSGSATTAASAFPATITDDASHTITVKTEPARIISLAPADTEILFALGLGDKVVGVTSYDDYPSEVASITKVGDFVGPNVEAVAAAKPDLIFATNGVQADVVKKLSALGAPVVVIDPKSLASVYTDIGRVGTITGTSDEAGKLVGRMKERVALIQREVSGKAKPTAFIEIGQSPLYTAGKGTLMDELITLAGGTNVVTQPGYIPYSAEQLVKADPAVYFATKGSTNDPTAIEKRPGYASLSAVKNHRIVIVADDVVSRGGPRIVDGLSAIAKGLHPDALNASQ